MTNEVKDFWRNLSLLLRVRHRVISTVGNKINVGEKFTVRFTVFNVATPPSSQIPRIHFLNPQLRVRGTEFAARVDGGGDAPLDLPVDVLRAGEFSHVDLEFVALKDMDDPQDWLDKETIARAWPIAQLDTKVFFRVWNLEEIEQEIDAPL